MANPTGNHQEASSSSFNGHVAAAAGAGGGGNQSNGNSTGAAAPESSASAMKHNPGISLDWTSEEQAILDDGLAKWVKITFFFLLLWFAFLDSFEVVLKVYCNWVWEVWLDFGLWVVFWVLVVIRWNGFWELRIKFWVVSGKLSSEMGFEN